MNKLLRQNKLLRLPLALTAAALLAACAGPRERVTLVPDPDGHVGRVDVKTAAGAVQLNDAYASTRIEGKQLVPEQLSEAEVQRRYGHLLSSLPASPRRFTLNFEFGTDRLTAQSRAMLPTIRAELQSFPAPEVVVSGHTDGIGAPAFNDRLSLERANRARDILVAAGIPREAIQVFGRGAREPLVRERPGIPEPRNQRVEIKLR